MFLEEVNKPENEIQIIDQMEILKEQKPENQIEYIDSIELVYQIREWIAQPSDGDKLTILKQERPENVIEERDDKVRK